VSVRNGLAIALAVLSGVPSVASAATTATLPGAPREGLLTFSVPVEGAFLDVAVHDARERLVSGPAARRPGDATVVAVPLATAAPGTYRVTWRALSTDGQVVRGEARVTVGPPAGAARVPLVENVRARSETRPLGVAGRLLLLVSPVALLGLIGLLVWIVAPAWRRSEGEEAAALGAARWWPVWWCAVAAGALGLLLAPVAQLRSLGAGAGDLASLLLDTRWGAAWIVQASALGAAVLAWIACARPGRSAGVDLRSAAGAVLAAPPAVALGAIAWAGHASSGTDRAIGIGADVLHSWATALWLGGLAGLLTLVVPAIRRTGEEARTRLAAGVVVRFSTLAVSAVAVLVVTGVYRALAELSSLDDLVNTPYGQALLVKLVIFALMLVGGAYNRFVVHPRLERAALGLEPSDRGAALRLRTSVGVELVLALAVMIAVAVLGSLPPPA
jgi:copper transport protein